MHNFLGECSYWGQDYFGWQIQVKNQKTIQGEIESCLKKIGNKKANTLGASRTDRGVHALKQVFKISVERDYEAEDLKFKLNSLLEKNIRINHLEKCNVDFHPLQDIANKTYRYYFTDNKVVDPFSNLFVYQIHGSLDLILIQEACELVKGEHDFQNFMCKGTPVKSSVREIFNCQLYQNQTPTNFFPCSGIHYIEFQGNGFLKQMVRLLMGGILNIGLGKKTLDELKKYLEVSMPDKLGPVVPAHGLFLWDMNIKN